MHQHAGILVVLIFGPQSEEAICSAFVCSLPLNTCKQMRLEFNAFELVLAATCTDHVIDISSTQTGNNKDGDRKKYAKKFLSYVKCLSVCSCAYFTLM